MDKTYNDLMDIVNRTKKFDTPKTPRSKPRPTPVVEEEDFDTPVEYDVVEEKPKRKTKSSSSLFADNSAISSMLEKSSKKKSTSTAKKKPTSTAKKKSRPPSSAGNGNKLKIPIFIEINAISVSADIRFARLSTAEDVISASIFTVPT